jgi:hypothetical protein
MITMTSDYIYGASHGRLSAFRVTKVTTKRVYYQVPNPDYLYDLPGEIRAQFHAGVPPCLGAFADRQAPGISWAEGPDPPGD